MRGLFYKAKAKAKNTKAGNCRQLPAFNFLQ